MKKYLKIISIVVLVLCMVVIFILSNENSVDSTNTSLSTTKGVVDKITLHNVDEDTSQNIAYSYDIIIREVAHVIEYLILGLLVINVYKYFFKVDYKCFIICMLFCIIYALSDEIHQSYIPGRTFQYEDIFLDTLGCLIGISHYYFFYKIKEKKLV